jgi:hypothetical protein
MKYLAAVTMCLSGSRSVYFNLLNGVLDGKSEKEQNASFMMAHSRKFTDILSLQIPYRNFELRT